MSVIRQHQQQTVIDGISGAGEDQFLMVLELEEAKECEMRGLVELECISADPLNSYDSTDDHGYMVLFQAGHTPRITAIASFELFLTESIEGPCKCLFCNYNICICKSIPSACGLNEIDDMPKATITREEFLDDRQGRTFADVLEDPEQPFEEVLAFFSVENRQRRMEESELHHDRAAIAGVVRELESVPAIDQFLSGIHAQQTQRFRQAIGVLVRIVMQRRGWKKTGRKGSLGVRATASTNSPSHNTGGLSFWFVRAERYTLPNGMPFQSVTQRLQSMQSARKRMPNRVDKSEKSIG